MWGGITLLGFTWFLRVGDAAIDPFFFIFLPACTTFWNNARLTLHRKPFLGAGSFRYVPWRRVGDAVLGEHNKVRLTPWNHQHFYVGGFLFNNIPCTMIWNNIPLTLHHLSKQIILWDKNYSLDFACCGGHYFLFVFFRRRWRLARLAINVQKRSEYRRYYGDILNPKLSHQWRFAIRGNTMVAVPTS